MEGHDKSGDELVVWCLNQPKGKIKKCLEIIPNLWLGNKQAATDKKMICETLHITCVVNLGAGHTQWEGVKYLRIGLKDEEKEGALLGCLEEACTWINEMLGKGERVMVHCSGMFHRSPSVVAAFLVAHRNVTLEQAWKIVRHQRPQANPNKAFALDLQIWEMQKKEKEK